MYANAFISQNIQQMKKIIQESRHKLGRREKKIENSR